MSSESENGSYSGPNILVKKRMNESLEIMHLRGIYNYFYPYSFNNLASNRNTGRAVVYTWSAISERWRMDSGSSGTSLEPWLPRYRSAGMRYSPLVCLGSHAS